MHMFKGESSAEWGWRTWWRCRRDFGEGREDVNWVKAGSRVSILCSEPNFLLLFHQSSPVKMNIARAPHPD